MGKITPGALYVGSGRRYVDSQALRNIAHTHDVVEMQDGGWRILGASGVVACSLLGDRPPLPEQRGSLYEVSAAPGVLVSMARTWVERGQLSVHDTPAGWHTPVDRRHGSGGAFLLEFRAARAVRAGDDLPRARMQRPGPPPRLSCSDSCRPSCGA